MCIAISGQCFLVNLFLIGGWSLHNGVLVPAVQQRESAISIHIPLLLEPSSHPPPHPSKSSQSTRLSVCVLVAQLCPTLCNSMDCSLPRLLCPWESPGKNPGVGCHSILQRVSYSNFPLTIYFTLGGVYISMPLSQFIPPSPFPTVSTSPFSMSVSLLMPCK